MRVFDSWRLDLKLGIRMLYKYPGLALSGGAGIAVAVAIAAGGFSVIYGNLLASSLPLDEGDRVVSIGLWDSASSRPETRMLFEFHSWKDGLKSVQDVSAYRAITPNLIALGRTPESVRVAAMTASGFRVARVQPLLGRYLTDADERTGAQPVVVIGEDEWRNRYASDPGILNRTIQLGATTHSVAGVMPKGFAFPFNHHFWVPLRSGLAPSEPLTGANVKVFGRLAAGAGISDAQAELAAFAQRTAIAFPKFYSTLRIQVAPYPRAYFGLDGPDDVSGLIAMQGLILSLLLLVCLNVAILVYTRTAMRDTEIGLRSALGAGRSRIVMQLFLEALVLSVTSALGGVAIAAFALRQVADATLPIRSRLPYWLTFTLSPEAVLYGGVLSVVAAVIVGVVPGLQATARQVQSGMRIAGAGSSSMRLGKVWTVLIVVQVAFAVALLPPAVFHAWDDLKAGMAGTGFAADTYLSAQIGMEPVAGGGRDAGLFGGRQAELQRRLEAEPKVEIMTFSASNPGDERGARVEIESGGIENAVENLEVRYNRIDVDFFRAFAVPVLAGRGFVGADLGAPSGRQASLVSGSVVVNQSLAQQLFGGSALGRRVRYVAASRTDPAGSATGRWYEIVGIVADFPMGVSQGMKDNAFKIYHPVGMGEVEPAVLAVKMRGGGAAAGFGQRFREVAAGVDPDLDVRDVRSLEEVLRSEQWIVRLEGAVFLAITISVLLLSSAGVYALMSFTVSQRRREIGIRMALGASRERILAGIFSRALAQLGSGAAGGAALGLVLERSSDGNLMEGHGPVVLTLVALVLTLVGFLAVLGPARRSLRIEPTEALREQ